MKKVNKYYLKKIRELNCSACGQEGFYGVQAHHNTNRTGLGGKAPDIESMPLCYTCHYDLHFGIGVKKWENKFKNQDDFVIEARLKLFYNIKNSNYPKKEMEKINFTEEEIDDFIKNNSF
jgi:hypothetical protein|tara:strand:+ start:365 stop:724 length:360 start_codon:yes stop_codon:yes gene_type:complete